uniref:B30.2/SPRY domain-containing protein n=1 Tax=Neogobius melanostomus TaxID=47308 RepID=A0A8C6SK23_9GOBI
FDAEKWVWFTRLYLTHEQRALSALREEQLRQKKDMSPELQEVREKLSSLSSSIQELEKQLPTGETSTQPKRISQQTTPRLRPKAGLLLDQAKILGNLGFRVWSNMRSIVSYSPVILDPNTAAKSQYLSEDLRGVRYSDILQNVPNNLERFSYMKEVLGSEGFSSGIHQWDVEVGDLPHWTIGAAKESVDRKGEKIPTPKHGVWALYHNSGIYNNVVGVPVSVKSPVQKLRVKLDYDLGEVSFYDADDMTHLYTHFDTSLRNSFLIS